MTNLKLTKEQIEALRALSAELADKLESGEAVTLERAVEKWEPRGGTFYVTNYGAVCEYPSADSFRLRGIERQTREAAERLVNDQRIFNRLHAYREEFAPGYVVPPVGQMAWAQALCSDGQYRAFGTEGRTVGCVYMPVDVCQALCDKLNSGEVVL